MDIVVEFPASNSEPAIFTIEACSSNSVHFVPLMELSSAFVTAELLTLHVFLIHGLPIDICCVSIQGLHHLKDPASALYPYVMISAAQAHKSDDLRHDVAIFFLSFFLSWGTKKIFQIWEAAKDSSDVSSKKR